MKEISQTRIFTLKDLVKEEHKLDEVGEVMLDLSKKKEEDYIDMEEVLKKCSNMKALRITSKNQLSKQKWKGILQGMEYLKFLK